MAKSEIPIYESKESLKQASVPDFQSAFEQYGEAANTLSAIGSKVAQVSSNAIAQRLGTIEGQKPHGELTPGITEFDKNFADSYHAQAASTLSIEAQKLLDNTQLELSKASRLTPELVHNANQQVQIGMNKLVENAPNAIKPQLQQSFASQALRQHAIYQNKLLEQQRQDQKNNIVDALNFNAKSALELATSGDLKGSNQIYETSKQIAENARLTGYLSSKDARTYIESIQQSKLNGRYINLAKKALDEGKYEEFLKTYAETDPAKLGMSFAQHQATGQAIIQQIGFLKNLEVEQQKIDVAKFNSKLLTVDPNTIKPEEIAELKQKLSPLQFENVHIDYLKRMRAFNKENDKTNTLIADWSNPRAHANAEAKAKDDSFNRLVQKAVNDGYSLDDAEIQVAATAGGSIPVFTRSLQNKLHSQNPANVDSAAQQIHALKEMGAGQAVSGLSDKDLAMYAGVQYVRDSQDPNKALADLHDRIYNQDADMQTAVEQKWHNNLHVTKPIGMSYADYGLVSAGVSKKDFLNTGNRTLYGNDIFEAYKKFYTSSGGDDVIARKNLKDYVRENYGYSYINNVKEYTKHPIEAVLNVPDNAIGVIHEDIANQLQKHFETAKKRYENGDVNEWWEVVPRPTSSDINKEIEKQKALLLASGYKKESMYYKNIGHFVAKTYDQSKPIEVIKHHRNGQSQKYQILIKSNPFATTTEDPNHPTHAGWDIAIQSGSGINNLSREARYLGIITYDPDVAFIKSTYAKLHPIE